MAGEIVFTDVLMVLVVGMIGGLVHDALQGTMLCPGFDKSTTPCSFKLGFIGDLIIGAAAAFVTYSSTIVTAPATTPIQLMALAFTSGIGGSAILQTHLNNATLARYRERLKKEGIFVD